MAVSSSMPAVRERVEKDDDDNNDNADRNMKHLKEFYIAIGVVGVFGSIIATLSMVVACTCIKYRIMLKGK